ncbi:MAG: signal peptidase I [Thermodesulfobacteriota bacterium]
MSLNKKSDSDGSDPDSGKVAGGGAGAAGEETNGVRRRRRRKKKSHVRETIEAIAIALLLALFIRAFLVQAFKIPSGSMEDTLLIGDHLLVNKFAYGFQMPRPSMINIKGLRVPFFATTLKPYWGEVDRGDIIVFRYPGNRDKDYIKRVIGVGGDKVVIRDNVVYINGSKSEEPYTVFKDKSHYKSHLITNFGPYVVPEDHFFMLGDNRDRSQDSRYWGISDNSKTVVHISDIKGKAFILYWSGWDRLGRIGGRIR